MDETRDRLPHVSCTSDYIDLGLYDPAHLRRSTLRFEVDDVGGTLARLADIGIIADRRNTAGRCAKCPPRY